MTNITSRRAGREKSRTGISFERFSASSRADFRFAPLNVLLLVATYVAGLTIHLNVYTFSIEAVYLSLGSALVLAVLINIGMLTPVRTSTVFSRR